MARMDNNQSKVTECAMITASRLRSVVRDIQNAQDCQAMKNGCYCRYEGMPIEVCPEYHEAVYSIIESVHAILIELHDLTGGFGNPPDMQSVRNADIDNLSAMLAEWYHYTLPMVTGKRTIR